MKLKTMQTRFLYFFTLLFIIACDSDKEYKFQTIESFPVNLKLNSEVVELENMPNCPRYLLLSGNYLTLMNFDGCDKHHLHVYDKKTLRFLGSFGTNGRGPNELFAPLPRQVVNNDTISGIWIYNQRHKKRELLDIKRSLKTDQYSIASSSNERYSPIRLKNDSIVNTNSGVKAMLPEISTNLSTDDRTQFYQGQVGMSEDNSYIVAAMQHAKRVDIFNKQLNHQVSISYPDSPKHIEFNENEMSDYHNTYSYFEEVYVNGQKQIYLLMHKRSLSGRLTDEFPEVHVFTMKGKPLARYPLDVNKVFQDYSFDEESSSLLGLTNTEEGFPQIIRYRIPEL